MSSTQNADTGVSSAVWWWPGVVHLECRVGFKGPAAWAGPVRLGFGLAPSGYRVLRRVSRLQKPKLRGGVSPGPLMSNTSKARRDASSGPRVPLPSAPSIRRRLAPPDALTSSRSWLARRRMVRQGQGRALRPCRPGPRLWAKPPDIHRASCRAYGSVYQPSRASSGSRSYWPGALSLGASRRGLRFVSPLGESRERLLRRGRLRFRDPRSRAGLPHASSGLDLYEVVTEELADVRADDAVGEGVSGTTT